jgi:hypothetical protein
MPLTSTSRGATGHVVSQTGRLRPREITACCKSVARDFRMTSQVILGVQGERGNEDADGRNRRRRAERDRLTGGEGRIAEADAGEAGDRRQDDDG